MTHCQLLDDYLDHDLPPTARGGFEDHLLECADCRSLVAQTGELYAALAAKDEMPAADQVASRLKAVVAAQAPYEADQLATPAASGNTAAITWNHKVAWQWIAAAAVVLIAGVLALQLLGSEEEFAADSLLPPEADALNDRNREIDELLTQRSNSVLATDDSNSQSPQDAVVSNSQEVMPSLVRQVGDSKYDQLKIKSNNPKVTIVWMMESPAKAEETPQP